MGENHSSEYLWVKGGNKTSLVRDVDPGHRSFERWPRTPSPFPWGDDVVTPQEVLLPREVLVEATLQDHPEMVHGRMSCAERCVESKEERLGGCTNPSIPVGGHLRNS